MKRPLWVGVLVAPLTAPLASYVWTSIIYDDYSGLLLNFALGSEGAFFIGSVTVESYVLTIVIGIPIVLVLRRINRLSFIWIALSFAIVATISMLMKLLFIEVGFSWNVLLYSLEVSGSLGCVVGAVLYWVTGKGEWGQSE